MRSVTFCANSVLHTQQNCLFVTWDLKIYIHKTFSFDYQCTLYPMTNILCNMHSNFNYYYYYYYYFIIYCCLFCLDFYFIIIIVILVNFLIIVFCGCVRQILIQLSDINVTTIVSNTYRYHNYLQLLYRYNHFAKRTFVQYQSNNYPTFLSIKGLMTGSDSRNREIIHKVATQPAAFKQNNKKTVKIIHVHTSKSHGTKANVSYYSTIK